MSSASIRTQLAELANHIQKTDQNLPSVKILENIGDYSYVIKLNQFQKFNINLTIQVPIDFNLRNINICVNATKASNSIEESQSLHTHLMEYLKKIGDDDSNLFLEIFNEAHKFSSEHLAKTEPVDVKKKQQNGRARDKKSSRLIDEEEIAEKKCSMKTASDVLKRIIWDDEINKEFVTVGYLDRFLGLKECAFNIFDWGDIVEADLGALAIPKHRINYFKYKNEIIWNKSNRLDNVFGSTGSTITIYDVIKRLENEKFVPDESNEELANKCGRNKNWNTKSQPNYFVSIPIDNQSLKDKLFKLTCDLLDTNQTIEKYLVPDTSYHLTLCTLRIDTDLEMNKVQAVLDRVLKSERAKKFLPIIVNFQGICEFYNKVLYVKSDNDEATRKLEALKTIILKELEDASVNTAGNYYEFVPHLTIFKLAKNTNSFGTETVMSLLKNSIWDGYKDSHFGEQGVSEFQLCKMTNINLGKSYPVEYTVRI